MDYRKWGNPDIDEWREDPNSRKKLYASDLWEFGYWCYPSGSCFPRCCWPRRNCCPNQGC